jgi:hypothetical protein
MVRISLITLMIFLSFWLIPGCRNTLEPRAYDEKTDSQVQLASEDDNPSNVRFSSFQNPDSTWGFTIFVDSRPFLHYKKIPFNKADKGFASKKDAESVADIFVKMVKEGDVSPKITRKGLDTLGIIFEK